MHRGFTIIRLKHAACEAPEVDRPPESMGVWAAGRAAEPRLDSAEVNAAVTRRWVS